GYLYSAENPDRAHVHFTLYENAVPICPAPFFTQAARDSILNLVTVVHQDVVMCRSGNVMPPPQVTPYFNEADMARITAGYSSAFSLSPWGYPHDGLDIYPQGDLKPFQAACSGKIDALEIQQIGINGNWQVEVAVVCDEYVVDPDIGGYFIPLTNKYYFRTMSSDPAIGQAQLDNIMFALGQTVTQGNIIGYLKAANPDAHLHFELQQFGKSEFQVFGVTGIPLCPQAQFSLSARNSVLNLLQIAWPGAEMCYQ
ncbi:MAG: M23 family metallopeptidase, partial [Gammaproteobacteria bacterium]|nr:M23 family metallopeptidase [Gammaproteobacteria bacterium]